MGSKAFTLLDDLKFQEFSILEIGAGQLVPPASGDGSTEYFANFVQNNPNSEFFSIDKNEDLLTHNIETKKTRNLERVNFFCGDYKDIVVGLNKKFNFIYLDNFDYPPPGCEEHDWFLHQKENYINEYGVELTNENSAATHLEQTKVILDYIDNKAMIVFDDTFLVEKVQIHQYGLEQGRKNGYRYPLKGWYGKGSTAVPYLISKGWKLIDSIMIQGRDDYAALKNF